MQIESTWYMVDTYSGEFCKFRLPTERHDVRPGDTFSAQGRGYVVTYVDSDEMFLSCDPLRLPSMTASDYETFE